jgi:hypothetical protein
MTVAAAALLFLFISACGTFGDGLQSKTDEPMLSSTQSSSVPAKSDSSDESAKQADSSGESSSQSGQVSENSEQILPAVSFMGMSGTDLVKKYGSYTVDEQQYGKTKFDLLPYYFYFDNEKVTGVVSCVEVSDSSNTASLIKGMKIGMSVDQIEKDLGIKIKVDISQMTDLPMFVFPYEDYTIFGDLDESNRLTSGLVKVSDDLSSSPQTQENKD